MFLRLFRCILGEIRMISTSVLCCPIPSGTEGIFALKAKNKAKKSIRIASRRQGVCIDPVDCLPDACPQAEIRKDLRDAPLIRKRRFLQDTQVFQLVFSVNILRVPL